MAIWGCGSPARCCQPAVAAALLIADLRSELDTHLALQALFLRVLLGTTATVRSFPISKHTGGGCATPAFSSRRVYLQFTWEVTPPPSPVEFSSHRHFYRLSRSWLLDGCPFFSLLIFDLMVSQCMPTVGIHCSGLFNPFHYSPLPLYLPLPIFNSCQYACLYPVRSYLMFWDVTGALNCSNDSNAFKVRTITIGKL
jgi:hypothetical protein